MGEIVLLSDERVGAIPVHESGEPLVDLRELGVFRVDRRNADPEVRDAQLRSGVADRLVAAQTLLPRGLRLLVVDGYRPRAVEERSFTACCARIAKAHPGWPSDRVRWYAGSQVPPPEIAPHLTGAAVDITLCRDDGDELPMGTQVEPDPLLFLPPAAMTGTDGGSVVDDPREFEATCITTEEGANRLILGLALTAVGLINYPAQWWHWSYGDRYWAFTMGRPAARYGPADPDR